MDLPDFLVQDDAGEIRLRGHRIGLFHVAELCRQGYSAERLLEEFPTLSPALIEKVIAFYLANQAEVDDFVERERAAIDRQIAGNPASPALLEIRERMKQRSESEP
jgi:uncharacterized protein (DUF433 family)